MPAKSSSYDTKSFRDRRKYFEQEIKQQSQEESSNNGSVGKRKKICLVSDQDLKTIRQEEGTSTTAFFYLPIA